MATPLPSRSLPVRRTSCRWPWICRPHARCAGWVVSDRGFASDAFRQGIWGIGARPAIPPRRSDAPVACPAWIYVNRRFVENLWAWLKEWRAVVTRDEKTARSFLGILCLAATADWIKL
jgi:hypothetical protein